MPNEKKLILDGRLSCAASMVRPDSVVADIGTDHAYIPIYLISHGISRFAIASDVNKGPLNRAKTNAAEYGVDTGMRFVLSDGLKEIEPERDGVTDIVICGMGGELISRILSESEYTKKEGVRLILQPMSCAAELRLFLADNGYNILTEKLCLASGKIYSCILAGYDGVRRSFDEAELILGRHNIEANEPLFADFARTFAKKTESRINGLRVGGHDASYDEMILRKLKEIIMKSEKNK